MSYADPYVGAELAQYLIKNIKRCKHPHCTQQYHVLYYGSSVTFVIHYASLLLTAGVPSERCVK